MTRSRNRFLTRVFSLMMLAMLVATLVVPCLAEDLTQIPGTRMVACSTCGESGVCQECKGYNPDCETCSGTFKCSDCSGVGYVESNSRYYNTIWALLPPFIAILLALLTKEVYSSLIIGILAGAMMYANFNLETALNHALTGGIVASLSDSYNVGILVFLVVLGALVSLMNKAGGSAAFGRWAETHIKTRIGAQLATILLGCLIFIDDYFNCLTVGSVMRPVTDKHRISRAKLAYLIDATAAPICIIAPISSWAAAVAGFAEDGQGFNLFIRAIPFNFYAILTVVMMIGMILLRVEYGPMVSHEKNASEKNDLFSGKNPYATVEESNDNPKGKVLDLILPVVMLIISCTIGMVYSGGFFSGEDFITAFSNSDASVGLALGSAVTLVFSVIYFLLRRVMSFRTIMESIPEGFKAMVPAILILTFAWTLKGMTDSLGAKIFVRDFVRSRAMGLQSILPAVVFVIGCVLAFATGTSWGTFGMLIPIVQSVFPMDNPLAIVCISACMAGAVCGDHCSPISDTTIMASAGAQCDHVRHVSTQLPYAITCAAVSFVAYLIAGFVPSWPVMLPVSIVLMIVVLFGIKLVTKNR